MAWLSKFVSAVIIFFSGIVGISPAPAPVVVPVDTLHTIQMVQESAATISEKNSDKRQNVLHPAPALSEPIHTAELPVCPSKTATNCRKLEGQVRTNTSSNSGNIAPTPIQPIPAQKTFQFTRLPFDIENVGAISPLGDLGSVSRSQTGSGHPYGNERQFIWHKQPLGRALYNVYAPGDGTVAAFKMTIAPPYGPQYQFYFRIDDNRMYYLAHINKLEPTLEAKISKALGGINETSNPQQMNNSIAIKAGDVLGQTGATPVNWDWGLTDTTYSQGVTNPDHYTGLEAGYARSVYDLASNEVKAQLRQLSGIWNSTDQTFRARVGDPPMGILGSDVKGTLSGTWFQTYDFNPYPHVAIFSPYAYDTRTLQIMLEIPDLDLFGRYQADEIKALGNASLNPAKITPTSGIVGYYLKNGIEDGVLIVRVNADETITVEATKGIQTLPTNAAFSSRAITLKR